MTEQSYLKKVYSLEKDIDDKNREINEIKNHNSHVQNRADNEILTYKHEIEQLEKSKSDFNWEVVNSSNVLAFLAITFLILLTQSFVHYFSIIKFKCTSILGVSICYSAVIAVYLVIVALFFIIVSIIQKEKEDAIIAIISSIVVLSISFGGSMLYLFVCSKIGLSLKTSIISFTFLACFIVLITFVIYIKTKSKRYAERKIQKIYSSIEHSKTNRIVQTYDVSHLNKEISTKRKELDELYSLNIIPYEYRNLIDVKALLNYINNGETSDIKEACKLHKTKKLEDEVQRLKRQVNYLNFKSNSIF